MFIYWFFFLFFSIMVYHRILNVAPCTILQHLAVHPACNSLCLLRPLPSPSPAPALGNHRPVLCVCESVSDCRCPFCRILDSTHKWQDTVLVFLFWLTSLSLIASRSVHVAAHGIIAFFFMAEWCSIVCVYSIFFTRSPVDGRSGCFLVWSCE